MQYKNMITRSVSATITACSVPLKRHADFFHRYEMGNHDLVLLNHKRQNNVPLTTSIMIKIQEIRYSNLIRRYQNKSHFRPNFYPMPELYKRPPVLQLLMLNRHYRGQPALAGTPCKELNDFVVAKIHCNMPLPMQQVHSD